MTFTSDFKTNLRTDWLDFGLTLGRKIIIHSDNQKGLPFKLIRLKSNCCRFIRTIGLWAHRRKPLYGYCKMVKGKKQKTDKDNLAEVIKDLEKYNLTQTEIEIVKLVARSFSNKEIAKKLSKSENTVKDYLSNVYSKLGIRNRYRLIVYINRLKYKPQQ